MKKPLAIDPTEFAGKRVLVTGGTKGHGILSSPARRQAYDEKLSARDKSVTRSSKRPAYHGARWQRSGWP